MTDIDYRRWLIQIKYDNWFLTVDDGCMTLEEYKDFTAGTPEIAAKIYTYFDTDNSNCLTVDKVASQFDIMDSDGRFDAQ